MLGAATEGGRFPESICATARAARLHSPIQEHVDGNPGSYDEDEDEDGDGDEDDDRGGDDRVITVIPAMQRILLRISD